MLTMTSYSASNDMFMLFQQNTKNFLTFGLPFIHRNDGLLTILLTQSNGFHCENNQRFNHTQKEKEITIMTAK